MQGFRVMAKKEASLKISDSTNFQGLSNPDLEKLIGDVIHKVKNNLGGISGFATLLSRDLGEESPHIRLIDQIQNSVMRLDDLVVDLMVLIRKAKYNREDVSLKPLLTDIIAQYEDRHQFKCKVIYQTKNKTDKVMIKTDSFIIERVFIYLVRFVEYANAILKKIIISPVSEEITKIEADIYQIELDSIQDDYLNNIITEYEPVEARLAFAILVKLIKVLQGEIHGICESRNHMKLIMHIS